MILCTDIFGTTGIYGEARALCMARNQNPGVEFNTSQQVIDALNQNTWGDVWQLDEEFIEGIREP